MSKPTVKQTVIDSIVSTNKSEKRAVKKVVIAFLIASCICLISNIVYQTGTYVIWIIFSLFTLGLGRMSLQYCDRKLTRNLGIVEKIFGDDENKQVNQRETDQILKLL